VPYRVSFLFDQDSSRLCGWSENYWNRSTSLAFVEFQAKGLRDALMECHGQEVNCRYVRISYVTGGNRTALLKEYGPRILVTNPTDPADTADYPSTALLIQLRSLPEPAYRTHQWMRGVQDRVIWDGGRYKGGGEESKPVRAVMGYLSDANRQWALRVQDVAVPQTVITQVTLPGVISAPGHLFTSGQVIRVINARSRPDITGTWRVLNPTATTFELLGYLAPADPPTYTGGARAYAVSYTYPQIWDAKILRSTSRKVGRPFGLCTGARR